MRGCVSWACVAGLVAGLAVAEVARADEKECSLDELTGELGCTLIASPSPPRSIRLSEDLPLEWLRLLWKDNDGLQRGVGCVRTLAGIQEIGVAWVISVRNTDTGEQLRLEMVCEWPGQDPPQPPPPPPTPQQLAEDNEQTLTLRPAVSPSMEIGGLTGLDAWLWCNDPGNVAASATLNGWTAEGAVVVVEVGWEINGPSGLVENTRTCGSPEAPAVTWMPETIGDYSIVVTTVWAGSWDLTWEGIPMGTYPLGPLALTAPAEAYPVDEYRGVLAG